MDAGWLSVFVRATHGRLSGRFSPSRRVSGMASPRVSGSNRAVKPALEVAGVNKSHEGHYFYSFNVIVL